MKVADPLEALRALALASAKVDRIHAPADLFTALAEANEAIREADRGPRRRRGSSATINHSRLANLVALSVSLIGGGMAGQNTEDLARTAADLLDRLEERARV